MIVVTSNRLNCLLQELQPGIYGSRSSKFCGFLDIKRGASAKFLESGCEFLIIDVQLLVTRPYLNQGEIMIPDVLNNLDVLGIENRSHCPGGRIWWSRGESNP